MLESDPGQVLTNGEIWTRQVYLGACDAESNWQEVSEAELPPEAAAML